MKLPELINGMSHLAYLEQMLEKGGNLPSESSPRGLVVSRDCANLHRLHSFVALSVFGNFNEFHRYPYLLIAHCTQ